MVFRQLVDDDLGCACYLIGDTAQGDAVAVDPPYSIEQLLATAEREDVRIVRVLETHTHADHVSGHGRLALEHGVPISIHPLADVEFPHDSLEDDQVLEVGSVRVRTIHTPGHRPEHCAFVVDERLVLTGDSLFVGDAARPDLAVDARTGAEGLFHSLQRLKQLPDAYEVYPGHVAGSLCGSAMSPEPSSTIGDELRTNQVLALTDVQAFVNATASVATPRPPTTALVVSLNRGPFVGAPAPLEELESPAGVTLLDVRPPDVFAGGHVPGAINVPLDGPAFATKAGFLLEPEEAIALHATSADEAQRAARGLRAVGFLELAGYVVDAEETERFEPVAIGDLERLLAQNSVQVLDVRELEERDGGYIPGSLHIPYRLLRTCGSNGLDASRPVVTICESGARAGVAASVLVAAGIDARPVLHGGIHDWHGHMVEFRRCGSG